jgi:hypothetical protein
MPTKSPVVTAAPAAKPETFLDQPFCLLDLLAARRAARFMVTTLYTSCVATRLSRQEDTAKSQQIAPNFSTDSKMSHSAHPMLEQELRRPALG